MTTVETVIERVRKADSDEVAELRDNDVGEMNNSMKMNRTVALLVVVSAAYAASTGLVYGDWDYSYTFGDGLVVKGSFQGTQNGDFVTGISDVTMSINGSTVTGPIYTGTFNGSAWVAGGVASFDVSQNDFLFINSDFAVGNWSANADLYILPTSIWGGGAFASDSPLNDVGNDATWSLVDPVPDGASTAMLCGMGLLALGWFRRQLA